MSRATRVKLTKKRLAGASLLAVAMGVLIASQAHSQASPSAYTTGYRYDAMHRLVGTISPDPDGAGPLAYAATRNTYDGAGRLIKVEKGELSTWQSDTVAPSAWPTTAFTILQSTTVAYDSQSRKIQETLSGGGAVQTVTQYSYDAQGNLQCTAVRMNPTGTLPASACAQTSPTPADGPDQITENIYDAANQLIQVRKGVGTSLEHAEATYSYTSTGKRAYTIDGDGNRALFVYDGHDRLLQWMFPSQTPAAAFNDSTQATALTTAGATNTTDLEQYAYDLNGNRTSLRKRDSSTINYTYDGLNRMTSKVVGANTAAGVSDCSDVNFTVVPNTPSIVEGTTAVFTITKNGPTSVNCSVSYATSDLWAVAPGDYTAKSGTLTFTPAQTTQTVSVTTIDDSLVEDSEIFAFNLSAPTNGASLGNPNSVGQTLTDNDTPPDHPPVAVNDSGSQTICSTKDYSVLANDSDPDGDPLTITGISGSGAGFSIVGSQVEVSSRVTTGSASATYTISDGKGGTATGTLTVTVTTLPAGQSCP